MDAAGSYVHSPYSFAGPTAVAEVADVRLFPPRCLPTSHGPDTPDRGPQVNIAPRALPTLSDQNILLATAPQSVPSMMASLTQMPPPGFAENTQHPISRRASTFSLTDMTPSTLSVTTDFRTHSNTFSDSPPMAITPSPAHRQSFHTSPPPGIPMEFMASFAGANPSPAHATHRRAGGYPNHASGASLVKSLAVALQPSPEQLTQSSQSPSARALGMRGLAVPFPEISPPVAPTRKPSLSSLVTPVPISSRPQDLSVAALLQQRIAANSLGSQQQLLTPSSDRPSLIPSSSTVSSSMAIGPSAAWPQSSSSLLGLTPSLSTPTEPFQFNMVGDMPTVSYSKQASPMAAGGAYPRPFPLQHSQPPNLHCPLQPPRGMSPALSLSRENSNQFQHIVDVLTNNTNNACPQPPSSTPFSPFSGPASPSFGSPPSFTLTSNPTPGSSDGSMPSPIPSHTILHQHQLASNTTKPLASITHHHNHHHRRSLEGHQPAHYQHQPSHIHHHLQQQPQEGVWMMASQPLDSIPEIISHEPPTPITPVMTVEIGPSSATNVGAPPSRESSNDSVAAAATTPTAMQLTTGACLHKKQWKRLRSKKGCGYYRCELCGAKWKTPGMNHCF